MTTRVRYQQIFWIYLAAFVLMAFSFNSRAENANEEVSKESIGAIIIKKDASPAEKNVDKKTDAKVDTKSAKIETKKETAKEKKAEAKSSKGKNMIAIFETNQGTFKVKLFPEDAPKTVENFVGLAEGTKEWTDPKSGQKVKKPFYDGLIFHRVIPNFMIQGGDPVGNGTGGPGYKFEDEKNSHSHSKPGILSMANAGPNTNGSQFFVTVAKTPWLDGKHTIFGEVTEGYDVVEKISMARTGSMDRPVETIMIKKLTIERK